MLVSFYASFRIGSFSAVIYADVWRQNTLCHSALDHSHSGRDNVLAEKSMAEELRNQIRAHSNPPANALRLNAFAVAVRAAADDGRRDTQKAKEFLGPSFSTITKSLLVTLLNRFVLIFSFTISSHLGILIQLGYFGFCLHVSCALWLHS
ncbi:hypothetical protein IEQ34_017856 [Dendrobium chrysotoxum]|uniref:Uncharacterized protein n=1 Tax=Dendrobium chrysotoxum TaxID=161865 RepID=A0AAV7GCL8_DENCH|nr:hypothetical protein IEQ34_017856 [Dendrobium chrysotoxum]